jgi:enamine deaminase RidA (YjgF/YER057c/UK114 family)
MNNPLFPTPTIEFERRKLECPGVAELYFTVRPRPGFDLETQARQVFKAIHEALVEEKAQIFCERIFSTADVVETLGTIRREAYGTVDDGVPPTAITVDPGTYGPFAGVQIHAVVCPQAPVVLRCSGFNDSVIGRKLQHNGSNWLYVLGLHPGPDQDEANQAQQMFFCTGCFLRRSGASMKSVARTWLWFRNICGWYDEFNAARNAFFEAEGLIDRDHCKTHLPASTGIGMPGANGAACTLDLIAMPGAEDQIQLLEGGGDQHSAFNYGSAFSRAAVAPTLAGSTLYISGTAAIDREGETEHIDRIDAQIDDTIAHVRALLKQANCTDDQVLTALVYCKTIEIERVFQRRYSDLSWPKLTMIGDVCRPELLFEVEVTAGPAQLITQTSSANTKDDASGNGKMR